MMRYERLERKQWICALVICVAAPLVILPCAETQEAQRRQASASTSPESIFMEQQAAATLKLADLVLKEVPPQYPQPRERRLALTLLDGVFHERLAGEHPAVKAFYEERMRNAVADIQVKRVEKGAQIWKLYNHGFVVRTPSVTLAFDMAAGFDSLRLNEDVLMPLVKECDALIISHNHADHVEDFLIRAFLAAKKPVVVPPDLWEGTPEYAQLTRFERNADVVNTLPIQDGARELKVVVFPGHQEGMVCNTTLVTTPEALTFVHTGDEFSMSEDFKWIDQVYERYHVDVLFPNCWTFGLTRVVDGFKPKLIITGHEDELGHPIQQREPYWRSFDKLEKCSAPGLVMTWGESCHYQP